MKEIPPNAEDSWFRGQLLLNNHIMTLDPSTLERQCYLFHECCLQQDLDKGQRTLIRVLETDGATDGSPNIPRGLAYHIALSILLDLPFLVILVSAPMNSWINTIELAIADLSHSVSGCAFSRKKNE